MILTAVFQGAIFAKKHTLYKEKTGFAKKIGFVRKDRP